MNQGHIFIANLAKGQLGEEATNLLGSFLVTGFLQAALSRTKLPEHARRDFYLYVDEFQNFVTSAFADILAEARKYRLNLILAHQYLDQIDAKIQAAVLANVGTLVLFRLGPRDAQVLAEEFGIDWPWSHLVNLNPYEVYYKLVFKGQIIGPHQAQGLRPPVPPLAAAELAAYKEDLIWQSRRRYGQLREKVEDKINRFFGDLSPSYRLPDVKKLKNKTIQ